MFSIVTSFRNFALQIESRMQNERPSFFSAPEIFVFHVALLDLELAQDGVPADVNLVPLRFEAAQGAVPHLAQMAERGRVADQRMNFLPRGRVDLDGGEN